MAIASGKWKSRKLSRSGSAGKAPIEVLLASLPEELQRRWLEKQKSEFRSQKSGEEEADRMSALPAATEIRLNEALKRLSTDERDAFLNEARRLGTIVDRYGALPRKRETVKETKPSLTVGLLPRGGAPIQKLTDGRALRFTREVMALCDEAVCTNEIVLAREPARAQAPSPHTLDGWVKRFKVEGLLTFLRSQRSEVRGQRSESGDKSPHSKDGRKAAISPEAEEWINKNWRSSASARGLYRKLKKKARSENWTIPSETWLSRRWKKLPKPLTTLLLQGEKAYVGKFASYVPRDDRDLEALQMLCGDHSVRDVTVRLKDGSVIRPWLTTWQDIRTSLVWGWHLDLTPSSRTIGLAYANGVRTYGAQPLSRPDDDFYSYLYTDQGKDYRSHSIQGQTLDFPDAAAIEGGLAALTTQRRVGLIDDLGLKQLLARGYNAREKPVERYHRDISTWEQETFDAEYCGRDAKNKPDAWKDAWARHQRLLQRAKGKGNSMLLDDSPFMTLDDYRDALAGFITEWNSSEHVISRLGGARIVPIEEYRRLYTTRYTISEEALVLLLMKSDRRMVGKNGVRMFQNHWSYLHEDLWKWKDHYVEVRYDDSDYGRLWVIPPDGSILECQLVTPTGRLNPNKQTLGMIKEASAHERKAIKQFNFLTQSMIRGESVEDRVAAAMDVPEAQALPMAASGGAGRAEFFPVRSEGDGLRGPAPSHTSNQQSAISDQPSSSVHLLTRMDGRKHRAAGPPNVTAQDVSEVEDNLVMFDAPQRGKVEEFDFDEEE